MKTDIPGEFIGFLDIAALEQRFLPPPWARSERDAKRPSKRRRSASQTGPSNTPQTPPTDVSDGFFTKFSTAKNQNLKGGHGKGHVVAGKNLEKNPSEVSDLGLVSQTDRFPEIAAAVSSAGAVALDIETFGPRKGDGLNPWRGDIRLLTLRVAGASPWLIDLQATGYDLGDLGHAIESVEVIAHNAKFDLLWLAVKCGVRPRRVFCTLTAARLLTAGTKPGNNLDQCLERYLGIAPTPDQSRSDWGGMFLTEAQLAYAARDVMHLHDLAARLDSEIGGVELDAVKALEMQLLPAIVAMEETGLFMDRGRLEAIRDAAREVVRTKSDELRVILKSPTLNPGSPDQIKAALSRAGIQVASTNEESLKAVADDHIIPAILALRGAEKSAQQATSLLDAIEADGRIHGRFEPTGTDTGRFSSKSPNLQNIGRGDLRDCFRAPDGSRLIVADYSQIELRAAAAIAGEEKMIEAYRRGDDLHRLTAATVLDKPIEEVTKEDRQMSKACFSGDTEVLTPTGWVRFDRYDGQAPVAQFTLPEGVSWNPPRPRSNRWGHPTGKVHWDGNGSIEFVRPLAFESFSSRVVMAHTDRNSDLVVTPDHEIAFVTNTGNPTKRRADEVTTGNCRHFIAAGFLERAPQLSPLMTRALAMVVADGSFADGRVIRLGFTKMRKIQRCIALLMDLRVEPHISVLGRVTTIKIHDEEFTQHILRWLTRKKDLSWDCLTGVDAAAYLDEAAYWDSHIIQRADHRRVMFTTTSEQTVNVMQAMAATCGVPSTMSYRRQVGANRSPVFGLSYRLGGSSLWRASWNLKQLADRQSVFCVQVPSGAILVRRNGKVTVQGNCNFGLLYGQSAKGLVRYAATTYNVTLADDDADEIRRAFFRTYGALRQWHGESHNAAERGVGEVRTVLGRRRLIPESADAWQRFTALVNTPVQGGCADGMKRAIVLIASRLHAGARIVSTVHDEVIVEAPEADAEAVCALVRECMIAAMSDLFPQVPIEVEAGVCQRWSEK